MYIHVMIMCGMSTCTFLGAPDVFAIALFLYHFILLTLDGLLTIVTWE